ncbi:MAG: hypothetical protein WB729_10840 [Candidatus Sulfotelmatobacter sp.]|jgi:hypothetical protein
MQRIRSCSSLWILVIILAVSVQAQSGPADSLSKVVETNLVFPPPVQWTANETEISLVHVAWGPADSPEMVSKGRETMAREQPAFYPDRPYVLALGFRAKSMGAIAAIRWSTSGLFRVTDTDGNTEAPMVLTPEGFVPFSGSPGIFDIHFDRNMTTEYWDLFPVAADQKEFLFQVFSGNVRGGGARLFFKIVLQGGNFAIVDVSPRPEAACIERRNDYAGTVGAGIPVKVHLAGKNATLSGTEEYQRVGKKLWLRGSVDSLGNFVLEERYPEDQVTGIFKGKFSDGCQTMQGYFSKPDGSRLQPFELRQVPVGSVSK